MKRRRRISVICMVCILVFVLLVMAAGCGTNDNGEGFDDVAGETETDVDEHNGEDNGEAAVENLVVMCGRSVMEGWFEHWGWDWEGDIEMNGYSLRYGSLEADLDTIADSFAAIVDGIPEGQRPVVFFKFCFADFDDNLPQLKGIIEEVVRIAGDRGLRLIIGNALPMNQESTSTGLVDLHREYNEWLEGVASENPGSVWIYDFYGQLSDADGALRAEYDVGDSHLTEAAYEVLDATFFPLLGRVHK